MRLKMRIALMVFVGLVAQGPAEARADVKVVATLGDLAAAAREIGGKHVEVVTLASSREDPHYVDAKPSYIRHLSDADLVVYNGMSLEVGWLPALVRNCRNGAVQKGSQGNFDASEFVERKGVPDVQVDRSMGDVHPEGNPHYTHAPRQMARVALALGERLGALDGAHAAYYDERAHDLARACLKVARKWEKKFRALPSAKRKVAVYHAAWVYVLDWLHVEQAATVEPKPGIEPNPAHVAGVVETMQTQDVSAVLRMEYDPASTVETIAGETGATVITSQGQTPQGKSYVKRVENLARGLHDALAK